jgi:hypothetical protein
MMCARVCVGALDPFSPKNGGEGGSTSGRNRFQMGPLVFNMDVGILKGAKFWSFCAALGVG